MNTIPVLTARHRPGRPPVCSPEVATLIIRLRLQDLSYQAISTVLNHAGIPTPAGRPLWHKSYVDRLLHTQYVKELWKELI